VVDNLKWRARVHRRVIEDVAFKGVIRDACAQDPIFFMNGFGWTYNPRGKTPIGRKPFRKVPFILYEDFQDETFLELIDHIDKRDLLIEKSRDMGASWLCISAIAWYWLFHPLNSFLLVSRVEEYVDKPGNPKAMFWKFDYLVDNLPRWLQPAGYSKNIHRRNMHAENPENGSVIDGESTNKRVARGDRRTAIVLDEFAAVEQGESVLSATRDATDCRIFNSTPEGTNNAFYKMKLTRIDKIRLHWTAHPLKAAGLYTREGGEFVVLDKEYWTNYDDPTGLMIEYDRMITDREVPLPDGKRRSPWYADQCDRAGSAREIAEQLDIDYEGSGHQFFSPDKIQEVIDAFARPPFVVGDLEYDEVTAEPIRFREDPEGRLKLWCMVSASGKPMVSNRLSVGGDVSAGTGASNSCLAGIDMVLHEKVFEFASPFARPEKFAYIAVALCRWFKGVKGHEPFLIWESGGPGRQFGSRVTELQYGNIYLRRNDATITRKVSDIPGYAATTEGKVSLLGDYRAAVEGKRYINRSRVALEETLEYVFSPSGAVIHARSANKEDPSGAKSNHGDRVTADALAWKGVHETAVKPERAPEPEIPVGSLAWRNQMREAAKKPSGRELGEGW